jgi:L,D-transpeptidase ErfK/SrfK
VDSSRRSLRGALSLSLIGLALPLAWDAAHASEYVLPEDGSSVIGEDASVTTVYEDTLPDLAHRYSLGYYEIIRANPGVDVWIPGTDKHLTLPGRRILPPGPRQGMVVNLPEHRLYFYPKPRRGEKPVVITYPVSIGKMDWRTPLGETRIVAKVRQPSWYPPESVRLEHAARGDPLPKMVPPGPDNPLGEFAMRLDISSGSYLIHGTNNPLAVGMAVTHGCIRMYPEDIAALFPHVPVRTKVSLINEPVKAAWVNGELLIEVHPPVDAEGQPVEPDLRVLEPLLEQELGNDIAAIHWDLALETLGVATGIPTLVGLAAESDSSEPAALVPQAAVRVGRVARVTP